MLLLRMAMAFRRGQAMGLCLYTSLLSSLHLTSWKGQRTVRALRERFLLPVAEGRASAVPANARAARQRPTCSVEGSDLCSSHTGREGFFETSCCKESVRAIICLCIIDGWVRLYVFGVCQAQLSHGWGRTSESCALTAGSLCVTATFATSLRTRNLRSGGCMRCAAGFYRQITRF